MNAETVTVTLDNHCFSLKTPVEKIPALRFAAQKLNDKILDIKQLATIQDFDTLLVLAALNIIADTLVPRTTPDACQTHAQNVQKTSIDFDEMNAKMLKLLENCNI